MLSFQLHFPLFNCFTLLFRFLASGESYTSLASQYRIGVTTMSRIVPEVCEAIWTTMQAHFMPFPKTAVEWQAKAAAFQQRWDYPHCVGALDGKHVEIEAPPNSGSLHFNYKHSFSVVLLAMVDADYKFLYIDVGAYGKQSDGGVFADSSLGKAFTDLGNTINLPADDILDGADDLGPLPYVIVADEAFPLKRNIMRPYPGRQSNLAHDAYNYRHSRARRVSENGFGLLSERWRVYHTKLAVMPDIVTKIVMATTVLHNMLHHERDRGTVLLEESGSTNELPRAFHQMRRQTTRGAREALAIRDTFSTYFSRNPLPWQENYIRRGLTIIQ